MSSGDVGWAAAWGLTLFSLTISGGLNATSLAAQGPPSPTSPDPPSTTIEHSNPPIRAVLPPDVPFAETPVGERVFETVTLTNDGGTPFRVLGVAVDGEAFALGANGCGGQTLGPTESCVVEVIFEPQREGNFSGLLAMVFDGDESASVALTASAVVTSPSPTTTPPTSTVLGAFPTPPATTRPPATTTPPAVTTPPATTTSPATTTPPAETTPSDTSTPPTLAPGSTDDVASLRACNERASAAEVAYSPNLDMTVGVESEVEVFIGVGGVAPPTPTGSTTPPTTVVQAELACFIELELSGTGFEIETPVQSGDFTTADTGRWFWDVTPERPGQLDLELRIVPKLSTAAGFQNGTPRTFNKLISVDAVPRTVWQQVGDVTGGVAAHPFVQVALAAGFVGGASSFVKRQLAKWRSRRATTVDEGDDFP